MDWTAGTPCIHDFHEVKVTVSLEKIASWQHLHRPNNG